MLSSARANSSSTSRTPGGQRGRPGRVRAVLVARHPALGGALRSRPSGRRRAPRVGRSPREGPGRRLPGVGGGGEIDPGPRTGAARLAAGRGRHDRLPGWGRGEPGRGSSAARLVGGVRGADRHRDSCRLRRVGSAAGGRHAPSRTARHRCFPGSGPDSRRRVPRPPPVRDRLLLPAGELRLRRFAQPGGLEAPVYRLRRAGRTNRRRSTGRTGRDAAHAPPWTSSRNCSANGHTGTTRATPEHGGGRPARRLPRGASPPKMPRRCAAVSRGVDWDTLWAAARAMAWHGCWRTTSAGLMRPVARAPFHQSPSGRGGSRILARGGTSPAAG